MKIVKLTGGLGNQLFQYAFGESLRKRTDARVKYDIGWFRTSISHDHGILYLDLFDTNYEVASETDIKNVLYIDENIIESFYDICPSISQSLFSYIKDTVCDGNFMFASGPYKFKYSTEVYNIDSDTYFSGHWQASQYVDIVSRMLSKEVNLTTSMSGTSQAIRDEIETSDSVSLHIRRGDYTKHDATLSVDYYERCIKEMNSRIAHPRYYIFSDNINWVKDNLDINNHHVYVDHNNAETAHEDLILMTLCEHNIISNSTFSWWGAWLNQNDSKIVIAPDAWLGRDIDNIDILPDEWSTCQVSMEKNHR